MKKNFVKAFCVLAVFIIGSPYFGKSQYGQNGFSVTKTYPSPDVASLGNYGLVPANPFNGQADINIPLHTVIYKDLQVPINMIYNTSGHRVDDHPGWMGIGWSLQAGGIISRKVNGIYDEHPKEFPQTTYSEEKCYYYNCGRVADNFENTAAIQKYALENVNTAELIENAYDASPDEFIFNVNGYSGIFYITRPYHNGPVEIKVKPNGPYKLKAEITEIKNTIEFDDWIEVGSNTFMTRQASRNIYSIRITDDQGVQYIFGGTPNSIEFSNSGVLTLASYTIASAWHLTEIIAPGGYKILLNYKRAGRTFVQHKQRNATFHSSSYNYGGNTLFLFTDVSGSHQYSGSLEAIFITTLNPVYLTTIVTPIQTISFSTSTTNELNYPFDQGRFDQVLGNEHGNGVKVSKWQKLDEIDIQGIKKLKFNYRDQQESRLRLESLETQNINDKTVLQYIFNYNQLALPPYNSKMADHWGFYNGRSYAYGQDYFPLREPVASYLHAEMLETITYPTGGYLRLEYEPHYYKKVAQQFPFTVETETSNKMAGGLRIKKMTTAATTNDLPITKEYFYITNYLANGTNSSGILSGIPRYTNTGSRRDSYRYGSFWIGSWGNFSFYYGKIVDNNFLTHSNTNGNHVTYSEVTEKSGEGFIVYKYSNHDNGYLDNPGYITYTNFNSQYQEEGFVSKSLLRGLLLNTDYFDKNENPVRSLTYEYLIDTSTSYFRVPVFFRSYEEPIVGLGLSRVATTVFFTRPVLLKSEIETLYASGTTGSITTIRQYKHFSETHPTSPPQNDHFRNTEVSTISSAGKTLKTILLYPVDMLNGQDPNGVYQGMLNQNLNSAVVEQKSYENNLQLQLTRTNYYAPFTGLYRPQSVQLQKESNPVEVRLQYLSYDQKGNLLSQVPSNAVPTQFIWDYTGAFLIAEITGSSNLDFAYTSFEADGTGYWNIASNTREHNGLTGNKHYSLLNGIISKTGLVAAKSYTVSYWSSNGALNVSGTAGSPVQGRTVSLHGTNWTNYQHRVSGITTLTITGAGKIDELRLFPQEAMMLTYCFDPVLGLISQTDARNSIVYYEYDAFGRLDNIKDLYGNMLKKYCYNYKGQRSDCITAFGNDAMTQPIIRNDCAAGYEGEEIIYRLDPGVFVSFVSKSDANTKALADIQANAQQYANQTGACKLVLYAKLDYTNYTYHTLDSGPDQIWEEIRADMYIRFYLDAACTQPAPANNLQLLVHIDPDALQHGGGGSVQEEVSCNGNAVLVSPGVAMKHQFSQWNASTGNWQVYAEDVFHHYLHESRFIHIAH